MAAILIIFRMIAYVLNSLLFKNQLHQMNAGKTLLNFDVFHVLYTRYYRTFSNKMVASQWSVMLNIQ